MGRNSEQIVATSKDTRSFGYQKGEVTLNFALRTDIKTELRDFLECLKKAADDVEKELMRNNKI